MAAVKTAFERALNKVAIAAVLVVTMIFLAPIYWIVSTSFKPRNLATTIPPTVIFEPDVSPFVKLALRRSQLREQPTPEQYASAPWCERLVFDGGEKVVRDGHGNAQLSATPAAS
jgi:multiple sugar transport system permease protein